MNCRRRLAAIALALGGVACARPAGRSSGPTTAGTTTAASATSDDPAFERLRHDPALAAIGWSKKYVLSTLDVFVSGSLSGDAAESARIVARRHYEESGLFPILTRFSIVPATADELEDWQRDDADHVPFVFSQYMVQRSKLLANLPHAKAMKAELPTAVPITDYDEGHEYLSISGGMPAEKLALWLVRGRPWQAATILSDAGTEEVPQSSELDGMFRRWNESWGAEPVYIDGRFFVEMTTTKQPTDDASLRALAWEFFLTCPSDREAFDEEPAARLLGRLRKNRWVCWWFVE